jgi:pimeloyl-ACP methyl ester carboxylesterase
MKPGNLEGGFAWYPAVNALRLAVIRDGPPRLAKIAVPTRYLWGERDPIHKAEWTDLLPEYFADVRVDLAKGAGHFVHYEKPELANREIVAFFKDR